jgi:hypothetical protein
MRYASLLVHVETGSTSSDARLTLAASLADRFKATLIGISAKAVRPPPVDAFGGAVFVGEVIADEEEQIRAELQAAEEQFRSHPGLQEVAAEWRSAIGVPVEVLAREARSADLVIVGRDLEQLRAGVYQAADPGEVVMAAGRPVLIVPPGAETLSARHVLVAWKDVREARRTVYDASPFLRLAEEVHVVEVSAEPDLEAAAAHISDVVRYLGRHQIKAHGRSVRNAKPRQLMNSSL